MITAMAIPPIPLQEAFGSGAAALARGGLLPPQYPGVTMRAHENPAGMVGGQRKTRDLGSEEAWWSGSVASSGSYMYWGFTDPACVS